MDTEDMLKRVQINHLGEFLMGNQDVFWKCAEPEQTAEDLLNERRDDLEIAVKRGEEGAYELEKLEEANRRIGFYMGLKAGARLMMELLGEGEIKFLDKAPPSRHLGRRRFTGGDQPFPPSADASSGGIFVPHLVQNWAVSATLAPQLTQKRAPGSAGFWGSSGSWAEHLEQKLASLGFSAPQAGQIFSCLIRWRFRRMLSISSLALAMAAQISARASSGAAPWRA